MRGKVSKALDRSVSDRITPAYAGKSWLSALGVSDYGDHPRLCGEKLMRSSSMCFSSGSPPPMRGKVNRSSKKPIPPRITPAYAGKSTR